MRQVDIILLIPEMTILGSKATWPSFRSRIGLPQSWGCQSYCTRPPLWCQQAPSPTKVSPTSRGHPDHTWQLPPDLESVLFDTDSNPAPRTAHFQQEEKGRGEERSVQGSEQRTSAPTCFYSHSLSDWGHGNICLGFSFPVCKMQTPIPRRGKSLIVDQLFPVERTQ